MRELTVGTEYTDMRLDRYISKACKEISKMSIQKMIRIGRIKVNGTKVKSDTHLTAGDKVSIYIAEKPVAETIKKDLPKPDILYEDAYFIAVNKPAGLIVHPDGKKEDSLTERIISYLHDELRQYDNMFVPGVINRLDTNTSGIVLTPKTPASSKALNELMQKNKITKKYLVLVKGIFPKRIKAVHYANKDIQSNKMELSDVPLKNSEEMISIFDPIESKNGCTLISAQLITGKTHQIRAQLGKLGYPVAGDIKYGDPAFNKIMNLSYGLNRQFLHCFYISFPLWTDYSTIKILCNPPSDLQKVLNGLNITVDVLN